MQKVMTCLGFNGRAEEAVDFYTSVFKNSKVVSRSAGPNGKLVAAVFEIDGQRFLVLNDGPPFTFTMAMSLVVNCDNQKEIDYYWEKLSAGGKESMCGWLEDKFGVSWQVVPSRIGEFMAAKDPARWQSVMSEVLKMNKIDLATLERAYGER